MSKKTKLKFTLLLCAGVQTSHLVTLSVLSQMAEYFPDASTTTIQLISSITSMAMIFFAFFSGRIAQSFTKKSVVLFSLLSTLIGGLAPFVYHSSVEVLIVCAFIVGIGMGLIAPTITSLIADHFDGSERIKMFGYQVAFFSLGGVVFILGAAWLANGYLFNVYLIYLLVIPVAIVAHFLLPKELRKAAAEKQVAEKIKLNVTYVLVLIIAIVFGLSFNAFGTNISMFLYEIGITNTTVSGTINAISQASAFLAGLVFGWMYNKLKRFTFAFVFFVCGIGLLLATVASDLWIVVIMSVLIGTSMSLLQSNASSTISRAVPSQLITKAMGIYVSCNHIGLFLSPIIITGVAEATGVHTADFRMGLGGSLALICAVLLVIAVRRRAGLVEDWKG